MIITIHQPEYLPWLGFFDRIAESDIFIILDDVGYQKNGFINRNKIKTAQGWQWITVPVKGRSPNQKINEVLIDNQSDWREAQLRSLKFNYSKAPYFGEYSDFFEAVFKKDWELICDLDIYLIENIIAFLGLKTKIEKYSDMNLKGVQTERLVDICKKFGADTYLSGPGGKEYMDLGKFEEENIKVVFQEFKHPEYSQQFMKAGFIPCLSIIDLLFNCGEKSLEIIKSGVKNI